MSFDTTGWQRFAYAPRTAEWAEHARITAIPLTRDPQYFGDWLRCGGTWFVGVNILPNDPFGRIDGGPPLAGPAIDALRDRALFAPLDRAQVSVIYPGYPQASPAESPASLRFRRDRDAAHVDGLLPVGAHKLRHLHEPHGFVLGLPLNDADASPMVVWEGSHLIMRGAFSERLNGIAPIDWARQDLTDTYQVARKRCFETCARVEVRARAGEAYLIDRLALHGVAPWKTSDSAPSEGRMIAYFRPELVNVADWLS